MSVANPQGTHLALSPQAERGAGKRRGTRPHAEKRRSAESALGYGAYLTAHVAARIVKLKIPASATPAGCKAVRGKVTQFTAASRKRMIEKLHSVRQDAAMPAFWTLTFPDMFPSQEEAKRLLTALFKRLKRARPGASAVWRMEVIGRKRGVNAGQIAPHFHLMVWGSPSESWVKEAWHEVCGDGYGEAKQSAKWEDHMEHGALVEDVRSWRGVASYCSAYMAKDMRAAISGRVWGIHNRRCLPVDKAPEVVTCTVANAYRFRRLVRKQMHRLRQNAKAQTVFTSAPERWLLALEYYERSNDIGPKDRSRLRDVERLAGC